MKLRLLTTLLAAAALSGCATYDYAGGNGDGGYYHGRPSAGYGPYGGAYGYPGYGGYGYGGYSGYGYGYNSGYFGSSGYYSPYRYYRPHYPRRPGPDHDRGDRNDRPAPWRRPDGRYQDTGRVMIPPHAGAQSPRQVQARPSRPMVAPAPRASSFPSAPRMQAPRMQAPRMQAPRMQQRSSPPPMVQGAPTRRER